MKFLKHFNAKHWQAWLNAAIALGVFIMVLMFINFNSKVAENTQATRKSTASTNQIVKQQGDILDAIKQLAIDNKLTSEQKTNTIICMLQVPVTQRTTDTVTNCRKQSETGAVIKSTPVQSSKTPSNNSSSSKKNTPDPAPVTPPVQNKSILKNITTTISNILGKVGL